MMPERAQIRFLLDEYYPGWLAEDQRELDGAGRALADPGGSCGHPASLRAASWQHAHALPALAAIEAAERPLPA